MSSTADIETLVIGAGVVGLATGAVLARNGHSIVVVERENMAGQGVSARNSEVIHAGIYYPEGSLKARLCVEGRQLLYQYCAERNIPCKRIGKLIVATNTDEKETLKHLQQKAHNNGVHDLCDITAADAMAMQPGLQCVAALHSPSTGIVDSHSLMISLQADIESHHGDVACQTEVNYIEQTGQLLRVHLSDGSHVSAKNVVNSSGLYSVSLARKSAVQSKQGNSKALPAERYAKGNYFRLTSPAPFSTLIYPAPVVGGLGIHLTIDMAGQKRFGPDVEWLTHTDPEAIDYQVNTDRLKEFHTAIRRYWPELPDDSLAADYSGVRPKIEINNSIASDFMIHSEQQHGIPGLINLFGIESPGLTSCLAIAEHINQQLKQPAAGGSS